MSGIITFPNSKELVEIFSNVPLNKILIETINGINTDSIAIPLRNDIGISNFKFYKNHSQVDGVIEGDENHIYIYISGKDF